jgi:Tol biopolymer transport system component/DNA-binding winged helix-turn-helix (wHTH) protein
MQELGHTGDTVRFGVFEVDRTAGELFKAGMRIKIQDRPFELLSVLLERPGEVVSREELRGRLWPEDIYVDFDRNLNTAASRLREALGDSASSPRFVKTLPKRGYRFVAPVEKPEDVPAVSSLRAEPSRQATPIISRRVLVQLSVMVSVVMAGAIAWNRIGQISAGETRALPTSVPLTAYPGQELHPSFSPDGRQLAFCWDGPEQDNFDIYVKGVGPGDPLQLTTHPGLDGWPSWSPDGQHIAFLRDVGGGMAALMFVPALGGVEIQLAEIEGSFSHHASNRLGWSPDSRWLIFSDRAPDEYASSLFAVSVSTRAIHRLTFPPETSRGDRSPSWSPDGRGVVFARGGSKVGNIYLLTISKELTAVGEPRRVSPPGISLRDPVWAPDGRGIIAVSGQEPGTSLVRFAVFGSGELTQVSSAESGAVFPVVSRNGHHLVYSQRWFDSDIWRAAIPGADGRATPPERWISSTRRSFGPSWSPDGKRIALISFRSGSSEVWVCDSDGSNAVQLTFLGGPQVGWPQWSPDSRFIAFDSAATGQRDIHTVSVDGGASQRITTNPAEDAVPSWSRDGKWIYFGSSRTGELQVWKVRVNGGEPIQVTKQGGMCAFESQDGKYLYYAKDRGVTTVWRIPAEGGLETQVLESVRYNRFTVGANGIFFIPQHQDQRSILFFNFLDQEVRPITTLDTESNFNLSISPSEKWMLYAHQERDGADLMLVENFR